MRKRAVIRDIYLSCIVARPIVEAATSSTTVSSSLWIEQVSFSNFGGIHRFFRKDCLTCRSEITSSKGRSMLAFQVMGNGGEQRPTSFVIQKLEPGTIFKCFLVVLVHTSVLLLCLLSTEDIGNYNSRIMKDSF